MSPPVGTPPKTPLWFPVLAAPPPPAARDPGVRPGWGAEMRRRKGEGAVEVGGEAEGQL